MTQTSLFSTLGQTRLVETLSELLQTDQKVSHAKFGERLGKLVDLSDSFALSDALYYISKIDIEQGDIRPENVIEHALAQRLALIQTIAKSFLPDSKMRFKFPRPAEGTAPEELRNFGPYRRFYLVQQREIDDQVQSLRTYLRNSLSKMNTSLSQLAALDKAMDDTLLAQTGKLMSAIPSLIEKRFKDTLDQSHNIESLEWVDQFSRELQALLLAELEFRLLPVIGMVEAVNEEVTTSNE